MSNLSELEKLLANGRISRREFLNRVAILGLGATVSSAIWSPATHAAAPKKGGRFRLGVSGGSTAESFDPATYGTGVINAFMVGAIGNCLTEIDHKGAVIPELAESWEASKGADTWTFRLRKGVTFHNGKTLTADDVIASFNHHRGENTKSAGKPLLKAVTEINKVDNLTVEFKLDSGNADFPYIVSEYFFIIFPSKDGTIDWKSGVGTGGYKLIEFEPGVRYVGERYPDYWKEGRAHFDHVELIPLSDPMARTTALITGEVECIGGVDLGTVHLLKKKPGITVNAITGTQHFTMPMFTDTAPFDDVNVRNALKRYISHKYTRGGNTLVVYLLDPQIEETVRSSIQHTQSGSYLALEPEITQEILTSVRNEVGNLPPTAQNPVILTTMEVRRYVRRLLEVEFPDLPVLSYSDLLPQVQMQPIARVSIG